MTNQRYQPVAEPGFTVQPDTLNRAKPVISLEPLRGRVRITDAEHDMIDHGPILSRVLALSVCSALLAGCAGSVHHSD